MKPANAYIRFAQIALCCLLAYPVHATDNAKPEGVSAKQQILERIEDQKKARDVETLHGFPNFVFKLSEADKSRMDLHPSMFEEFWKRWHFVTTRWRQDVHEFRLTYANDAAWKTLLDHRTDYPVGAMFGKVVHSAEEDLALPSSVLPSTLVNRIMVMYWDPKHPKASSDGWLYLRYINPDPRAPQDKDNTGIWGVMSKKEVQACVECHARAADRGYVFSQPLPLMNSRPRAETKDPKVLGIRYSEAMKEVGKNDIPRIVLSLLESIPEWKNRKIMGYEGNFFAGALGEMGPVLAKLAQENPTNVYLIFDRDDPNTLEIASSVVMKEHKDCAGLVRLRGSGLELIREQGSPKKRELIQNGDAAYPVADLENVKTGEQGVRVRDVRKEYKPTAMLYTMCGREGISRQQLPLLYSVKDPVDGLPNYYFAPAIIE